MSPCTGDFYEQLPGFPEFSSFHNANLYQPLPHDWYIVITDVLGSTRAIEAGKYKQVNAVGVASIVALLNALKPLKIPYVFGGDGATACLPGKYLDSVRPALVAAREMSRQQFGLELRIGIVPVETVRANGHNVLVGKHQPHDYYQQAMFTGSGLGYAEKLVKQPAENNPYLITATTCAGSSIFEGFECRWNEIPSPHEENIALLIQATGANTQETISTYQEVIERIHTIYGDDSCHHPLREQNLSLTASPRRLGVESGIRTAFQSRWKTLKYFMKLELLRLAGIWLMRRNVQTDATNWGEYKRNLISNSDYRKFDEVLRMIIAGTSQQRSHLRSILNEYRAQGKIAYGIHAAPASLITCIVTDYNHDHVHFLDGANGGYAIAARELKAQLMVRDELSTN